MFALRMQIGVEMILIKTQLSELPETCDGCQWHECYPHPYKGWADFCGLMCQSLDDDAPEEWIYGGERPQACPLIEVKNE